MKNRFQFDKKFLDKSNRVASSMLWIAATFATLQVFHFVLKILTDINFIPKHATLKIPTAISILILVWSSITQLNKNRLTRLLSHLLLLGVFFASCVFVINRVGLTIGLSESFDVPLSTSICLSMLALSEYLRNIFDSRFARAHQILNLMAFSISICALFGILFSHQSFESIGFFKDMSIASVLVLMTCSFFMALRDPQSGWMPILTADNLGSRLLRRSLILCFTAIAVSSFMINFGTTQAYYDFHFAFDLIVVVSFVIFGLALFAITIHLNEVDRDNNLAIEKIQSREEDLFKAQALAKVGSWVRNIPKNTALWSPQMYEIFGVEPGTEIRSEMMDEFITSEDLILIREQISECFRSGKGLDIRHKIIRKDGSERFVHGRAELHVNSITKEAEVHGTVHDVTESELVLQQLLSAEKMYNDLYNEAPDMLLSVDVKSAKIIKCNRTLLRVLGYQESEIIGAYVGMLYSPDSRQHLANRLREFADVGSLPNIEIRVLAKDGKEVDVSVNSSAVRNAQGEVIATRSIWRDISQTKLARELSIKERAAAEGLRIKSNFVATMSHEIRTPLNGVIGMTDVLMNTELAPEQRDYVDTIKQSADTLLALVNDILDFSKIESGRVELSKIDFSIANLIEEIETQMLWSASRKGLELKLNLKGVENLNFYGDRNRLRQILTNLLSNAIKFTSRGRVQVTVKAQFKTLTTAEVLFEVADTGIGLYSYEIQRLFQPFTQSDSSISRLYGGTGLGLSISQSLARLMGGEIKVQSEPGVGSKFYFELEMPAAKYESQDEVKPKASNIKVRFNRKVLVAEDVEVNRKVIGLMLSELGCESVFVENGEAAVKIVEHEKFDLILMDCQMPILDGYQATRLIRSSSDQKISAIPIIALTANASPEDRKRCLDASMSDYLSKPITLDGLYSMLDLCLSNYAHPENLNPKPEIHSPKSVQIVDDKILNELSSLGGANPRDVIADILRIFETKLPHRLSSIRDALIAQDQAAVVTQVHALKSSGSSVGARKLARQCDEITLNVKQNQFGEAMIQFETLAQTCAEVSDYLENWLKSKAG